MKKSIVSLVSLLLLLGGGSLMAKMSGRDIASKVKHHNEMRSSVSFAKIIFYKNVSTSTPSETRKIVMKSKKGNNWKKTAFRFMSSTYRGTTFLSVEKGNKSTDYIYLNSVGRARRLASDEKQNNFIDTDFTNEDLSGIKLNDYRFKRIADMKRGGKNYLRVWAYKKDKQAKYSKYLAIVDPTNFVMVEARVFNKQGRLARIMKSSDVRLISGKYHVPFTAEVKDLIANHKTIIKISRIKANVRVSNSTFRPSNMSRAWR